MLTLKVCLQRPDTSCAHFCPVVQVEFWKQYILAPVVGDGFEFSIPHSFNKSVTYEVGIDTSIVSPLCFNVRPRT